MTLGIGIAIINQFCGISVLLNYTGTIFASTGSQISPHMAAIIGAVIQVLASTISALLVDRAGRKFLMCFSVLFTGLGMACLGLHTYLVTIGYNLTSFSWVPVVCYSVVMFSASIGIIPLPCIIIPELLPEKVKITKHCIKYY